MNRRAISLVCVGVVLFSAMTAVGGGGDSRPARSGEGGRARDQAAPAPTHGLIQTEDGSWVPASYFSRTSAAGAYARGPATSRPPPAERVPGSFIVTVAPGLDPHDVARQVARDYGGEVAAVYDEVVGGFAFSGPDDVRERLTEDPRVGEVEDDYIAHLAGHSDPVERVSIRAPGAWASTRGAGAVVAVLDTGINAGHPSLSGRVLGTDGSCVSESTGGDVDGHGTAVTGHALGHYGVLPDASAYGVKVFPSGSESTTYSRVICGLNKVKSWLSSRQIHAANLSLSGSANSSSLRTAVRELRDAGVTVVAAAGNSGGSVGYPAAFPEAVAVSALDPTNARLVSFSSRGPEVDMGAPGDALTTTLSINGCCRTGSGTSYSSPQVAAAAALVKSLDASLSPDQVLDRLQRTGQCPPGATVAANTDGGNCNGPARTGDGDGSTEPALDLEGLVGGVDAPPTASFVAPVEGQVVRDAELAAIKVAASDDDTPAGGLDVDVRVGDTGDFVQTGFSPSASGCPSGCYTAAWPTGRPDGPVTVHARITEPGRDPVAISVDVVVDNVDDPPTASWLAPAGGATVGSPVSLRVSAADDREVAAVRVYQDGTERASLVRNGSVFEGSLELAEGAHTLRAVATDSGGQAGPPADVTFTVGNLLYAHGFTSGAWTDGWYESSSGSPWHQTSACADGAPAPPFAYFGQDASCTFSTSSSGYLYSPVRTGLPTGEQIVLTFDTKERVESCSGCSRDRRYVQVNYGSGWRTLYYRNASTDPGSGVWESRSYRLDACSGRVQIRFRFDPRNNTSNDHFGWAIDNVTLARSGQPSSC